MANLKYSRQREAIKQYLAETTSHPTADTVYMHIKEKNPNISLGTVYRNLNLLAELGEIQKLSCGDGCDHYDGDIHQHYHILCEECGRVFDLNMKPLTRINELANETFPGEIHDHSIIFYGKCEECCKKKDK